MLPWQMYPFPHTFKFLRGFVVVVVVKANVYSEEEKSSKDNVLHDLNMKTKNLDCSHIDVSLGDTSESTMS